MRKIEGKTKILGSYGIYFYRVGGTVYSAMGASENPLGKCCRRSKGGGGDQAEASGSAACKKALGLWAPGRRRRRRRLAFALQPGGRIQAQKGKSCRIFIRCLGFLVSPFWWV